jgi:hypothetical protein
VKIRWVGNVLVPPEKTASNIAYCKSLGLPGIRESERPVLAVVGGGPSVARHLDELKNWPGDVWVSGGAYPWAVRNGIRATFFTIDQSPEMAVDGLGAEHAVVATCCDPSVFEMLANASVEVFDIHHEGEDANHGATSVTAVPKIALLMGYREVHFFGCDSSFEGSSHAYKHQPAAYQMVVQCNGGSYETAADMLMQAEFMSLVLRSCPGVFVNRSEGLLKAMVEAPGELDYEITHGDQALCERVRDANATQGQ